LQAWDITVLSPNIEEATHWAWETWKIFAHLKPLLGFVDMINWDKGHHIMLEYTKRQALLNPQVKQMMSWVLLVAPGRAMVITNPKTRTKERLDEFVKVVKNVNEAEKKKVADGGLYINRVVLSKRLATQAEIEPSVSGDGRTYYDRYKEKGMNLEQKEWGNKPMQIDTPMEVLAQCSNFHYTNQTDFMLQQVMNKVLKEHLTKRAIREKMISQEEVDQLGDIFIFHSTTSPNLFKIVCSKVGLAHWLCCTVKDQPMTQQDSIATISFKSTFHQPMGTDWTEHTQRLCLTDYPHQLPTNQQSDQAAPSAADRLLTPRRNQPSSSTSGEQDGWSTVSVFP
jgi:hypothetical protein